MLWSETPGSYYYYLLPTNYYLLPATYYYYYSEYYYHSYCDSYPYSYCYSYSPTPTPTPSTTTTTTTPPLPLIRPSDLCILSPEVWQRYLVHRQHMHPFSWSLFHSWHSAPQWNKPAIHAAFVGAVLRMHPWAVSKLCKWHPAQSSVTQQHILGSFKIDF